MDEVRVRAYRTLLAQAALHLKWDLAGWLGGFSWLRPWHAWAQANDAYRAAFRASTFHNLAIHSPRDFAGLCEVAFWDDVARFQRRFPRALCPYRVVFEACLAGQPINIVSPEGVLPARPA